MAVSGLNVVYLYVRDLDRSIAFYRDVLGLPVERNPNDEDWADARFAGGGRFGLHRWHDEVGDVGLGSVGISFTVGDVDEAATRLRETGVEVSDIGHYGWGSRCEFVDPDGYRLGLFQPPR